MLENYNKMIAVPRCWQKLIFWGVEMIQDQNEGQLFLDISRSPLGRGIVL
jgi:hypothetical protein